MFGAHLSIAGGMHNALLSAEKFGMETVQVFTKNQMQWKYSPLEQCTINEWKLHQKRLKFRRTVSHDSYLINLAEIISRVKHPKHVGVCLDTAHLFAAGYDIRGRKYHKFRKQLDSFLGVRRVKVLHLNDSKKPLGSRVDRHDHIGRGLIGIPGFKSIVRDADFANVPK